jgi:lysozyme
MHGPESMRVEVTLPESQDATYVFTLDLIDTHYSPSDATRMGVDISHHSGDVDWAAVREAGFSFAYVKASEGVDNLDPRFEDHWAQLKALDFPRGAYHFYVTEDDPVEQAKFFASRLKDDPGTLPPVVDVELLGKNTEGDMTETLLSFLKTLEAETGLRPMIYTSPNFWDRYYRPEFSNYHLWLSEVGVVMPKVPFGWRNWTLWQRKINQSLEGVEKDADISILHPELDLEDIDLEPNTKTR